MKADNEPTVSLPVYFFYEKNDNNKKTKEPKQNENKVSNAESPTPDLWRGRSALYLMRHDN